jgi:hypothetical protein
MHNLSSIPFYTKKRKEKRKQKKKRIKILQINTIFTHTHTKIRNLLLTMFKSLQFGRFLLSLMAHEKQLRVIIDYLSSNECYHYLHYSTLQTLWDTSTEMKLATPCREKKTKSWSIQFQILNNWSGRKIITRENQMHFIFRQ